MFTRRSVLLGMLSLFALVAANLAQAADSPATTISVEGMHCAGCASKVAGNLQKVAGVNKAE